MNESYIPTISVRNLQKHYPIHEKEPGFAGSIKSLFNRTYHISKAVDNISFTINQGELVGFIGPNGAGKTTTLKMLSGLLYPSNGFIDVLGHKPFERKFDFLTQISLVMGQKNQLWWDLPAIESFTLNKEIYRIPEKQFKGTLDELSSLLEVEDVLQVQVRNLSLGQRMKCELIAALLHTPKVLFLDEPTIGLDVVMQKKLRDFVKSYNEKFNATIILTSHYMDDVKELCKRVIIIDHGAILFDGPLDDIVKKFAPNKYLTVHLRAQVNVQDIAHLGKIKEYTFPKLVIEVQRGKTNEVASHLLKSLTVDDINIEEADIEDIIRQVFIH